jgi:hypoxanthine phosphoribosyltransferase
LTAFGPLPVLFTELQIRARVAELARQISDLRERPDLAVPILVGGFVFAADLLRALDGCGLSLPVEFLRLRSYGEARAAANEVRVLIGPGDNLRGRHVLLIDGVLDHGHTLCAARDLVHEAGARAASTVVVIDKRRQDALLTADFAAFINVSHFVVGYGMDDAGRLRSLPYVAAAD